jgi:hypothetical protein
VVHVRTTDTLGGAASLSLGAQLLKTLGLGSSFVASGSGGDNSANTVDLVGTNSIPVAFAPAFVVTATKQAANGQVIYEIASVNEEVVEKKNRFARQSKDDALTHIAEDPASRGRHRITLAASYEPAALRRRKSTREARRPRALVAVSSARVRAHILQDALTEGHANSLIGAVGF